MSARCGRILAVGRMKERFYLDAQAEYVKRLGRYGGVSVTEVEDEAAPEKLSEKQALSLLRAEGEKLLRRVTPPDFVVALAVDGLRLDSIAFAQMLGRWRDEGKIPVFVLGASLGLSESVLQRADERLSLSDMTMCHPLARVVLLEQIYRAQRILAGHVYHK